MNKKLWTKFVGRHFTVGFTSIRFIQTTCNTFVQQKARKLKFSCVFLVGNLHGYWPASVCIQLRLSFDAETRVRKCTSLIPPIGNWVPIFDGANLWNCIHLSRTWLEYNKINLRRNETFGWKFRVNPMLCIYFSTDFIFFTTEIIFKI